MDLLGGSLGGITTLSDLVAFLAAVRAPIQGYLAYKKPPPRRTLQQEYARGPMVVLQGGLFFMSEVPL